MDNFNSKRFAASKGAANLSLLCTNCGYRTDKKTACAHCGCSIFKVSRIVMKNPYRETGDEEDGYKFNNPGTAGQIGESGYGTTRFRKDEAGYDDFMANNYIPKDGSPADDMGVPGNSDKLMDGPGEDRNPLNPANNNEPNHIGPHNMQGFSKYLTLLRNEGDLFNHIRNKRKGK